MTITMFMLYILVGALAGSMSGLLGLGGGVIAVPMLAYLYRMQGFPSDVLMHLAAGTSLAAMAATTGSSLIAHLTRDIEIWSIFKRLLPGLLLGTVFGAVLADFLHSDILHFIFGLFVFVLALRLLLAIESHPSRALPRRYGMLGFSFAVGTNSGLLGIGGGGIVISYLTYCNVSVRKAIATALACGIVIAIVGSISFMIMGSDARDLPPWTTGYVYWPAAVCVAVVSPVFTNLGTYLSHRIPVRVLKRVLGVVLLLVAIQMLIY